MNFRITKTFPLILLLVIATGGPVHASDDHDHGGANASDETASVQAFRKINERMHEGMNVDFTGNADIDFLKGMIPHHQGAIEMAEVVLEHGEDEEIRALAHEIIEAQEAEIEQMRAWLAERGYDTDGEHGSDDHGHDNH